MWLLTEDGVLVNTDRIESISMQGAGINKEYVSLVARFDADHVVSLLDAQPVARVESFRKNLAELLKAIEP